MKSATLTSDLRLFQENTASIAGSKGRIKLWDKLWCPQHLTLTTNEGKETTETFPLPPHDHVYNFPNGQGLLYEADEVKRCLELNLRESPLMTQEETLIIAKIQQEINRQIGVTWLLPKNA